jgi:folate-binding protein YgfZ
MQGYNFIVLSAMENPDSIAAAGSPTPLSAALRASDLRAFAGASTPGVLDDPSREIASLLSTAGAVDLGWRAKIRLTGKDRLRWLNGMVTNTVQALAQDEGNYSFLLNAQGRIQGDCYVYRQAEELLLDTSRDQIPALLKHLDHYIIMDAVELEDVSDRWTTLALIGPKAPEILSALGAGPAAADGGNALLGTIRIGGIEVKLVRAYHVLVPHYELWLAPSDVLTVWKALEEAGAARVGLDAAEDLRVLEGIPLYGIDVNDHDLPQETNQARALNFNKGCYLGQEIVERIRSRGKVHRRFRQFSLNGSIGSIGSMAPPPFDLWSADQNVGRITSVTSLSTAKLPGGARGTIALGFAREEIVEGKAPIRYEGGTALPLEGPPRLSELQNP